MNKKKINEKICQKYLRELTIAHAIPRINECLILEKFDFKSPILDLGCGEGVFGKLFYIKGKIDVGLDVDPKVAKIAGESGVYKEIVISPAKKIPFKDNSFNTVFSNSVLEHIEDLKPVFDEVYRVLKKNGRFIFIVPDKTASDYFFYAELFKKIKLKKLSNWYINTKNKLYQYAHLENKKYWEDLSLNSGFKIKEITGLVSPKAVRVIDLFSVSALPDYILRRIFGRSFIFRPAFLAKTITPFILPYCSGPIDSEATGWCFELIKNE